MNVSRLAAGSAWSHVRGTWGLVDMLKYTAVYFVSRKSAGNASDVRPRWWRFESSGPTPT